MDKRKAALMGGLCPSVTACAYPLSLCPAQLDYESERNLTGGLCPSVTACAYPLSLCPAQLDYESERNLMGGFCPLATACAYILSFSAPQLDYESELNLMGSLCPLMTACAYPLSFSTMPIKLMATSCKSLMAVPRNSTKKTKIKSSTIGSSSNTDDRFFVIFKNNVNGCKTSW